MKLIVPVLAAVVASGIAGSATAGTLTNASVTLSSSTVSTPTSVTVEYTTQTEMGPNGHTNILLAEFPGLAFPTQNCTNGEVTLSVDGTPIVGTFQECGLYGGTYLQIALPLNVTVPAGSDVVVTVPNTLASTGPTTGTYAAGLRTGLSTGATIDEPASAPTYEVHAAPTPVPTLTEWAMILFGAILAGGAALCVQRRRQYL